MMSSNTSFRKITSFKTIVDDAKQAVLYSCTVELIDSTGVCSGLRY